MDFNELKDKLLSALGQATEATKDFAGKAADTTRDLAGKAAEKAKAGTRIAKLNIEISQEKESMKKTYLEIGKLYYDLHKDDPDGFFIQLCEEIAAAEQAIAAKEAEIADLKSGSDPDVDVEFEEIVEQDEAAAENVCECVSKAAKDACECAENAADEVCECAENAAEECVSAVEGEFQAVKEEFKAIEDNLKDAADEIVEEIGEVEE